MIDQVILAGLQGLARALGERLVKTPDEVVAIKVLTSEVQSLQESQKKTDIRISEMLAVFEDAARKVDGLIIQNSTVRFEATQNSPTLGDALVDLEKQISGLRSSVAQPTSVPVPSDAIGAKTRPSRLDGLDEEIDRLRSSGNPGV